MAKKKAQKRELVDTGRDKRYIRRDTEGKFKESDDQGRSLAQDRRKKAKTKVKSGQGGQRRPVGSSASSFGNHLGSPGTSY
jgi:hypothetical protein